MVKIEQRDLKKGLLIKRNLGIKYLKNSKLIILGS